YILVSEHDVIKSTLFILSKVPDHTELSWIHQSMTYMGELERKTQFKDKSEERDSVSAALFTYPTLMDADILLYDTAIVPVGDDQTHNLELTRTLAQRFNNRFGYTFVVTVIYTSK